MSATIESAAATVPPSDERAGVALLRDVVGTMANRVAILGMGLATSVIVARALGPDGRGLFAVSTAVTATGIQLTNVGLHAANAHWASQRPQVIGMLLGNSLFLSGLLGGVAAVLVVVAATVLPGWLNLPPLVLVLSALGIPIGLAYLQLQNLLLGLRRIKLYNALELLSRFIVVGALGAIILADGVTVASTVGATIVGIAIPAMLAGWRLSVRAPSAPSVSGSLLREMLGYGARAYVAALASFLLLRLDIIIVSMLRGAETTGYYSIAVALTDIAYLLPVVVGTLMFPRLSAMHRDEDRRALTWRVSVAVGAVMSAAVVAAAVVAAPAIELLFGPEFLPSADAFRLLLPGLLALSIYTVISSYFAATGMPLVAVAAPLAGLGTNVALDFILVPTAGAEGAAAAASIGYVVMLVAGVLGYGGRRSA